MKTSQKKLALAYAAGLGLLVFQGAMASAAVIAWGRGTDLVGPGDISTTGTFIHAIHPATELAADVTIGDTTFTHFTDTNWPSGTANGSVGSDGFISVSLEGGGAFRSINFGNASFPSDSPSSVDYSGILLRSVVSGNSGAAGGVQNTITLGGASLSLDIGTTYEVQIWTFIADNQARTNSLSGSPLGSISSGNNSTVHGQYSIGTFTADAATQTFTVNKVVNDYSVVSDISLRAVPEPATLGLLGLSSVAMMLRRRRQMV